MFNVSVLLCCDSVVWLNFVYGIGGRQRFLDVPVRVEFCYQVMNRLNGHFYNGIPLPFLDSVRLLVGYSVNNYCFIAFNIGPQASS